VLSVLLEPNIDNEAVNPFPHVIARERASGLVKELWPTLQLHLRQCCNLTHVTNFIIVPEHQQANVDRDYLFIWHQGSRVVTSREVTVYDVSNNPRSY
jgi:hypothetical protein